MFLFQIGSIRRVLSSEHPPPRASFLFQIGSIRSGYDYSEVADLQSFYSRLVRLEGRRTASRPAAEVRFYSRLVRLEDKPQNAEILRCIEFLFQIGSIRRVDQERLTESERIVSIPDWFD